jgi:diketogulonate reductase-like aldo/keto reductase
MEIKNKGDIDRKQIQERKVRTMERSIAWIKLLLAICLNCIAISDSSGDTPTEVTLSNGEKLPLIGIGVGNLEHDLIRDVLKSTLDNKKRVRLIDTARASRNEEIISDALSELGDQLVDSTLHIITKVWYTHLGYERTKISVKESLKDISSSTPNNLSIHVHVLLHWPKCDDTIPWMHCLEEENELPKYVRDAGPPPHLDKENAWKESWRALEDIYQDQTKFIDQNKMIEIASIGVSNFHSSDLESLIQGCRIHPHILQGNIWSLLFDPHLMTLIGEQNITFQAYNVINGISERKSLTPTALEMLKNIGNKLTLQMKKNRRIGDKKEAITVTEAMVVMVWLLQQGVAIIPRASSLKHFKENSPETLTQIPTLSPEERALIRKATEALLRGEDLRVSATFHNLLSSRHVHINWTDKGTGVETPVAQNIQPGQSKIIETHPGHTFVAYDETKKIRREFSVTAAYGEQEVFRVDEL